MTLQNFTLVLGGAASGKSDYAESLVLKAARAPVYIATAQAFDHEMTEKIARHRAARGAGWRTVEAPLDPGSALSGLRAGEIALIDCATLWLSNLILAEADLAAAEAGLIAAIEACAVPVVVVSNEVGAGIVPDNALARRFRAAQGGLNRRLAARADRVVAVMAGLPLALKGELP
ncbi:bifunctional adenosylcobinamide kinase/adenosylcobinamide-phosphate guanylyltransferase [Limimaricola pyoseonensis]|uniref:Bifunctional adenosylcobalamin biosynthesis protein n=1 Tax=Limimaricola pyoseonensis TaxID=521013 RepID=A0A1G7C7R8_9RHOB|nr:bifunctional adenosylcobinamide kinase/adenosylcobinamide-phosphate guanylyltransferase [Limimaricola pyoseonensis]SDE35381.1 adenosylcobinamide kinase /adenosylcobinamide-phosphate guanylyltransferase [Limimaricola pyoseonensis]